MTTIAAVKKGKRLCLAADTMTLLGDQKDAYKKQIKKREKIIRLGDNYLGSTGHTSWGLILSQYFSKNDIPAWKTQDEIFDVFLEVHKKLKESYYLYSSTESLHPFASSEFSFLLINRYGIFEIEPNRAVYAHPLFAAIGSGEQYALGAIHALYDKESDPQYIAKRAIQVAAHFDQKTALPIHTALVE
jgi:ATP-dependent HslUV protease, peptidase subunit HslV